MYIQTTFTPPKLTIEQKQALARSIRAVGRDQFVFALREYISQAPAVGSKSVSMSEVLFIAQKNNSINKKIYTIKQLIQLAIIVSAVVVFFSVLGAMYIKVRILGLFCVTLAMGFPLSMLYLVIAWQGMESWVTNVLHELSR